MTQKVLASVSGAIVTMTVRLWRQTEMFDETFRTRDAGSLKKMDSLNAFLAGVGGHLSLKRPEAQWVVD
jgi:hypothetical protein